jgi:phage FluMu protein Com
MEKTLKCVKCTKAFRVVNESPDAQDIPKTNLSVDCPFCQTRNEVTWPKGTKYMVVP